jgi:malonyl CoA-acyl carrier protein transacylase/phosphopantetheinyl transferase (holo-ACP synthase)
MIENTNFSTKQENNSCSVAITGLSYRSCHIIDGEGDTDLNSLLIQLAKEALIDDQSNGTAPVADKNYIVSGNCSKANLIATAQLFPFLGFTGQGINQQISSPLQGLKTAINELQSLACNMVLLILCDSIECNSLEDNSGRQNSYYLSTFILRPISKAIENNKKVYASIPLLLQTNNDDQLIELKTKYKEAQIPTSSINLFTLSAKTENSISTEIAKLSQWFVDDSKGIKATKKVKNDNIYKEDPWCSLRIETESTNNQSANGLTSLVETIISIQQRTFLSLEQTDLIEQINLSNSPFYLNFSVRPWFHPQIHLHFRGMSPQPNYNSSQRRAALHVAEQNGQTYHLVAEEFEDANELKYENLQPHWPSELFTFCAESHYQLINYLQSIESSLFRSIDQISLKDLAFTINANTFKLINESLARANQVGQQNSSEHIRAAFVCTNIEEFLSRIKSIINTCLEGSFPQRTDASYFEHDNIYWHNSYLDTNNEKNKLAFVLPGLGAAYPNMLSELCLHFPEIRAIFDFVDYLSVSGGSALRPSDRIFCRLDPRTKTFRETPASLAVMDSAVVTVLMAEWAIFTLLLNLDIVPDILLGSSTGEFAALTMSGAVDIFKAAPLFYHLSTGMVHALPINQLINLRSLRVNDAYEKIEAELANYKDKVYLSANLSPRQLILTGDRDSINSLLKSFESKNISADFLPFAIPYHTSLVADVVSADNPDIEALQISNPLIESWSCSLAAPYPNKADKIKKMTTDLFSHPILFRESIEALYAKGVKTFVEVGPRGNLAPIITETLQSRPHVSLAANRSDISAITQLQNVLAILFVNDIYMDLSYLFARRTPKLSPLLQEQFEPLLIAPSPYNAIAPYAPNEQVVDYELQSDIITITRSFQQQLQELEQQVMAYLVPSKADFRATKNDGHYLSSEIPLTQTFTSLPDSKNIFCRKLLEKSLPTNEDAFISLIETVLTPLECEKLQSFNQPAKRRQWLAGRIAAKEAVRSLIANLTGVKVPNTDIEIDASESGKPYLAKLNTSIAGLKKPVISITHKDGEIIAVAADSSIFFSVGIDLESKLLDDDLEDFILNSAERNYVQQLSGLERAIGIKKIWSAKESVAKLLGLGLPECLTKLSVIDVQHDVGRYRILSNAIASHNEISHAADSAEYVAHVTCSDTAILSLALI